MGKEKNAKDSKKDSGNDNLEKDNPADGKGNDENIKALQRKLTEKDVELKKFQDEKKVEDDEKKKEEEESKSKIDKLTDLVGTLQTDISSMRMVSRREDLAKKYPDMNPDLIVNLEDDKIEEVVKAQRSLAQVKYGDAKFFQQPKYSSIEDIDKEIEAVQNNGNLSGEDKAVKVMELNESKTNFTD